MAPIGYKLGRNVFQTIPDVSFFDFKNAKMFGIDVDVNVRVHADPQTWLRSAANFEGPFTPKGWLRLT